MKHILVVNDSQELLEIFRRILEEEGYKVTLYSYTLEEMAEVERINPDLIILDIVFGAQQASGWNMLEKLKLNCFTESIPVIICSAATNAVREQQGYLTTKGVQVLLKPFNIDDLLHTIEKALRLEASVPLE